MSAVLAIVYMIDVDRVFSHAVFSLVLILMFRCFVFFFKLWFPK